MPKSRKNTSRPYVIEKCGQAHRVHTCMCTCICSNLSHMMMHNVSDCVQHHYGYQINSMQSNHQQPSLANEIAASVFAKLIANISLPEKVAATTNSSEAVDIVKTATETFGTGITIIPL